jgi:hypothetical protein
MFVIQTAEAVANLWPTSHPIISNDGGIKILINQLILLTYLSPCRVCVALATAWGNGGHILMGQIITAL